MKKLLFFLLCLVGCSADITYSPWATNRFLVVDVKDNMSTLNTLIDGKVVQIQLSKTFTKGEEITLTYRKITEKICTDTSCTLKETYEVK